MEPLFCFASSSNPMYSCPLENRFTCRDMTGQSQQTPASPLDTLNTVSSVAERSSERKEKAARLAALMNELHLDAVLFQRSQAGGFLFAFRGALGNAGNSVQ